MPPPCVEIRAPSEVERTGPHRDPMAMELRVPCPHDRRRGLRRSELSVGLGHLPLGPRVAPPRDLSVTWRSYCLEIRDDYGVAPTVPEGFRQQALDGHAVSHRMLRIFEAARVQHGEAAVDRLYTEWGARYFVTTRPEPESLLIDCLAAAGLSPALSPAADDAKWDAPIREAMEVAYTFGGPKTQTPTIVVRADPPHGFKGPVMAPAPVGPAAVRLWDALQVLSENEGFFEFTRPRTNLPAAASPRLRELRGRHGPPGDGGVPLP